MEKLSDLTFCDLFVHSQPQKCMYKVVAKAPPAPLAANLYPELEKMYAAIEESEEGNAGRRSFRFSWEGISYRVEKMRTLGGRVYVLRRLADRPRTFAELGLLPFYARQMLSPSLKDGLVICTGSTGSGKSSVAAAVLLERLTRYGGLAWTVENPVETSLEGKIGEHGMCYQIGIDSDQQSGETIASTLRGGSPQIIFLGEIRESTGASQALRAAASGHIVITTIHGSDIVAVLERLTSLARQYEGDASRALLADSLRVVLHLRLEQRDVKRRRILRATGLFLLPEYPGEREAI